MKTKQNKIKKLDPIQKRFSALMHMHRNLFYSKNEITRMFNLANSFAIIVERMGIINKVSPGRYVWNYSESPSIKLAKLVKEEESKRALKYSLKYKALKTGSTELSIKEETPLKGIQCTLIGTNVIIDFKDFYNLLNK